MQNGFELGNGHHEIKRRDLLKGVGLFSVAALLVGLPKNALSEGEEPALEPSALQLVTQISANHGHALALTLNELVLLLRRANAEGPQTLDIQGVSGHAHSIVATKEALIQLLVEGAVTVTSSTTFGHIHSVQLVLQPLV